MALENNDNSIDNAIRYGGVTGASLEVDVRCSLDRNARAKAGGIRPSE